ncbi:hypothetical protein ACQ7B2_01815, partial [Escherichia coli]
IEHFLEPSFTPSAAAHATAEPVAAASEHGAAAEHGATEAHEVSRLGEIGLMAFSLLVAIGGISLAWKFYVTSPEISERLAHRWA